MFFSAEFWVAVAFVVFLLVLVYYKVPALIAKALDDRAEGIRRELDAARRVREEAQLLLADYQRKHRSVGEEAEAIVAQARKLVSPVDQGELYAERYQAALQEYPDAVFAHRDVGLVLKQHSDPSTTSGRTH